MAIEVYWGSGSPYAWRVLLALEHKGLPYTAHLLQFSKQEHKSPHLLQMNPRGRVPVLKDGEYVCFESLAILYYLDRKYPDPPIFGTTPEEGGTIMVSGRVDAEVTLAPLVDVIQIEGVLDAPGGGRVVLAIADALGIYGHGGVFRATSGSALRPHDIKTGRQR